MNTARLTAALGCLRTLAGHTGDDELLGRFASSREEAAFTTLLERHGPMVLGVCRRLLGHEQDAEDAFQTTFLLLARNAGSVRKGGSIAAWLHGAARRIAGKSRRAAARRRERERRAAPAGEARGGFEVAARELRAVLDEELAALPGRCRDALVLCYLEGLTLRDIGSETRCLECLNSVPDHADALADLAEVVGGMDDERDRAAKKALVPIIESRDERPHLFGRGVQSFD